MEAVARIDFGLSEGEFWRLTECQFYAYADRHKERTREQWKHTRFLATACAHAMGHDVDYMEEAEPEIREADPAVFEAWLRARAAPSEVKSGASGDDRHEEPSGVAEGVP